MVVRAGNSARFNINFEVTTDVIKKTSDNANIYNDNVSLLTNRTKYISLFLQASPWPDITWQKDGAPVSKKVTISNTEGTSQLLIPSAERSDTGIYSIIVKNIVGQETYSIEIRVTGE